MNFINNKISLLKDSLSGLFPDRIEEPAEPKVEDRSVESVLHVLDFLGSSFSYEREAGMKDLSGGFANITFMRRKSDQGLYVLKWPKAGGCAEKQSILKESEILEGLNHSNIIHKVEDVRIGSFPCLVLSRGGCELFEHILDNGSLDLSTVKRIAVQGFSALRYLKEKGITHGDIKLENILFDGSEIKIIDFGLGFEGVKQSDSVFGSPEYVSPEVFLEKEVSTAADIWGFAIVIFNCYTGIPLFDITDRELEVLPSRQEEVVEQSYPEEWKKHPRWKASYEATQSSTFLPAETLSQLLDEEQVVIGDPIDEVEQLKQGLLSMLQIVPSQRVLPTKI